MKMLNLSGMFPGVPYPAIRSLYQGYRSGRLHDFDTRELKAIGLGENVLKAKSERNTTDLEKNTAKVENGILAGQPIQAMADAFSDAVKSTMSGAVIILKNGQGEIHLKGESSSIRENKTHKPKTAEQLFEQKKARYLGLNPDGTLNMSSGLNKF
jgi:hypothetical protein